MIKSLPVSCSYSLLKNIITLDPNNDNYAEKIAAMETVNYAEHGILVNTKGEIIIDDGFSFIWWLYKKYLT